jgi:hypothetical protein
MWRWPAAALVALALGLAPLAGYGGSDEEGPPALTLTWEPCQDEFECATMEVPLDYANPDGERISLHVTRLPAGSPQLRAGVVMWNPGGPGAPVIENASVHATGLRLMAPT